MNLEQPMYELDAIKELSDTFDAAWKQLYNVLGTSPECPVHESFYKMERIALDRWADKWDVDPEAVHWFVYDNDWGRDEMGALHGAVLIPITSVESFVTYELDMSR